MLFLVRLHESGASVICFQSVFGFFLAFLAFSPSSKWLLPLLFMQMVLNSSKSGVSKGFLFCFLGMWYISGWPQAVSSLAHDLSPHSWSLLIFCGCCLLWWFVYWLYGEPVDFLARKRDVSRIVGSWYSTRIWHQFFQARNAQVFQNLPSLHFFHHQIFHFDSYHPQSCTAIKNILFVSMQYT